MRSWITKKLTRILLAPAVFVALSGFWGCEKREISDLKQPSFSTLGDVFIDDFTPDLAYAAFGGSDVKAFQVVKDVTYNNSLQSMRFDVPDENSANGSYAGGVFLSKVGRNLSGYNALTFYIKASQPANIGTLGFGNDFGANKYLVTLGGVAVNTNWKKIIIPIPDPSKLMQEKGLFYYAASPENGRGYTFWIDEVKFENLGSMGIPQNVIFSGKDSIRAGAETGEKIAISGLQTIVNLPSGVNQTVSSASGYFTFSTSNSAKATVDANGLVSVLDSGQVTITAMVGAQMAGGSLTVQSVGAAIGPADKAPLPTRQAANVISLYSNAYTNVPVDTWNTRWLYSTADESFVKVQGDDVIRYRKLNFVGIEFSSQTINATAMDGFHMDIWTADNTNPPNNFKIMLVDFGANGTFGGGDDKSHEITIANPTLVSNNWVSIDVPLSSFSGLTTRGHLAQMVLSGTTPNVYVDNVYFYKVQTSPTVAAPTPTYPAGNVLSLFSDAYSNLGGINLNPNWGQQTVVSQMPIAGNNTLVYSGLNYQGLEFGSEQNVSDMNFLHIDYFSANATSLKVFVLSPGVPLANEIAFTLPVPTTGWSSIDVPLSHFTAPIDVTKIFQLKFEGNGTIYLDNILFRKN